MEISKQNLSIFRDEFMKAVIPLEENFGITISLGNIRYAKSEFSCKLAVSNGDKAEVEQREFEQCSSKFAHLGIKKEMYRQEFQGHDGKGYILVGLNPKARKNICQIKEKTTGKVYCSSPSFLGIYQIN